jgi:WD40 repeat protein
VTLALLMTASYVTGRDQTICGTVTLWDTMSTKKVRTLTGHSGWLPIYCVEFSPDGTTLASGGEDKSIQLWDVEHGNAIRALVGHTHPITHLTFLPDGKTLISQAAEIQNGARVRETKCWDWLQGKELPIPANHQDPDEGLLSPDGNLLAKPDGNRIKILQARSGQEVTELEGHTDALNGMAFSPDSRILVTGGGSTAGGGPHPLPWKNGDVKVWDLERGIRLAKHGWHGKPITALAFSPDGTTFASAGLDGCVMFWDIPRSRMCFWK